VETNADRDARVISFLLPENTTTGITIAALKAKSLDAGHYQYFWQCTEISSNKEGHSGR